MFGFMNIEVRGGDWGFSGLGASASGCKARGVLDFGLRQGFEF